MIVYLNESVKDNIDKVYSKTVLFYWHCLKWVYQSNRQGSSWIKTIVDNAKDINKIIYDKKGKCNKNIVNSINRLLHDSYTEAVDKATNETNLDMKELDNNESVFYEFDSIENIADLESLKDWLISNAYSEKVISQINVKYGTKYYE